jgi:hypothetical protein
VGETRTNLSPKTTISEKFDLKELGAVEKAKYEPEGVELERLIEAEGGREDESSRSRIGPAEARGMERRRVREREESMLILRGSSGRREESPLKRRSGRARAVRAESPAKNAKG